MFYRCKSLRSLNLFRFNTSNVRNMNSMFYGCRSLSSLMCLKFNLSSVECIEHTFVGAQCYKFRANVFF